jgi:hypothetical protein
MSSPAEPAVSVSASASAPAAASGMKVCSRCLSERSESEYSSAQLKKKGKRICRHCVLQADGAVGAAATSGGVSVADTLASMRKALQAEQLQPVSTAATGASSIDVASSSIGDFAPPPSSPVPPHPLFPGQQPALFDSARQLAFYAYSHEHLQLPLLQQLIEADLSEPYSVFTYRYFLNFWPHLTFVVRCTGCGAEYVDLR